MVSITPKKDLFANLRVNKYAPVFFMFMGLLIFLCTISMFSLPTQESQALDKIESPRGGNKVKLEERQRLAREFADPVAQKIKLLDEQRALAKAELARASEIKERTIISGLTHADNPGVNPHHGIGMPHDERPHVHDSIILDNTHDFSHDDKHVSEDGAAASSGAKADSGAASGWNLMYHNKHKHGEGEHPHTGLTFNTSEKNEQGMKSDSTVGNGAADVSSNTPDKQTVKVGNPVPEIAPTAKAIERVIQVSIAGDKNPTFPLIRQAYATAIQALSAQGRDAARVEGEGETTNETEQPLDGVEVYHKAIRTGEVCSERFIPYKLVGNAAPFQNAGQASSGTGTGTYVPTKSEKELFHFLLDLVWDTSPTAFIELSPSKYPLQQALSPLLAMALPRLAVVLVPSSKTTIPAEPTKRTGRRADDGDDDSLAALVSPAAPIDTDASLHASAKATEVFNDNPDSSDSSGSSDRGSGLMCLPQSLPSNLYITKPTLSFATETQHAAGGFGVGLNGMYDCAQLIDGWAMLVGQQLPFEFEETLGRLICRCQVSLLPAQLPKDAYFSYWANAAALVKAAVASLGLCEVTTDRFTTGTTGATAAQSKPKVKLPFNFGYIVVSRMPSKDTSVSSSSAAGNRYLPVSHLLPSGGALLEGSSLHHLMSSLIDYYEASKLHDLQHANDASKPSAPSAAASGSSEDLVFKSLVVVGPFVRSKVEAETEATADSFLGQETSTRRDSLAMLSMASPSSPISRNTSSINVVTGQLANDRQPERIHYLRGAASTSHRRRQLLSTLHTTNTTVESGSGNVALDEVADEMMPRVGTVQRYDSVLSATWMLPAELTRFLDIGIGNNSLGGLWTDMPPDLGRFDRLDTAEMEPLPVANDGSGVGSSEAGNDNGETDLDTWKATTSFARNAFNPLSSSNVAPSDVSPVDTQIRKQQHLLQRREEVPYRRWLAALRQPWFDATEPLPTGIESELPRRISKHLASAHLVYIFGRHISALSMKVAASMTRAKLPGGKGLLVSVLTDSQAVAPHQALQRLLGIQNNIVCHSQLTTEQLAALLTAPERADASIIQLDIFARLLVLSAMQKHEVNGNESCVAVAARLEEQLAAMLQLATVSYLEMPSPLRLLQMLQLVLSAECSDNLSKRYADSGVLLSQTLQSFSGIGGVTAVLRHLPWTANGEDGSNTLLYRIVMSHKRSEGTATGLVSRPHHRGVSVYTLGHFGMTQALRRQILELYVELPLWAAVHATDEGNAALSGVAPWTIFATLVGSEAPTAHGARTAERHAALHLQYYIPSKAAATLKQSGIQGKSNRRGIRSNVASILDTAPAFGSALNDMSDLSSDRRRARLLYHIINQELSSHAYELAEGRFSFVDHSSGHGYLSAYLAARYPNATVVSLERHAGRVNHHVRLVEERGLFNNAVCQKTQEDDSILLNIAECPELFRFQLLTHGLADAFSVANLHDWGRNVGTVLSSALTTFLYVPPAEQVSLAMSALFPWQDFNLYISRNQVRRPIVEVGSHSGRLWGVHRPSEELLPPLTAGNIPKELDLQLAQRCDVRQHPLSPALNGGRPSLFSDFESAWLLGHSRAHTGHIRLTMTPLYLDVPVPPNQASKVSRRKLAGLAASGAGIWSRIRVPFVRCDIINMTRYVHHHYDYRKDGHARTYTMRVLLNATLSDTTRATILDRYVHTDAGVNEHYTANHVHEHHHHHHDGVRPEIPSHAGVDAFSYMRVSQTRDHIQLLPPANYPPAATVTHTKLGNNATDAYKPVKEPDYSTGIALPPGAHPNQNAIVQVHLLRDKDAWPIPYTSIHGITLISVLRLGLHATQRERFFASFLKLPLYEDMAPWNVVLMGPALDYIDYDTREVIFDSDIPKAYRVMTVLMNYKRTVEDFKRCGSKAPTVYGLPYVSDCVGSNARYHASQRSAGAERRFGWGYSDSSGAEGKGPEKLICDELSTPVPCDDGRCHTDYISCLRSLSVQANELSAQLQEGELQSPSIKQKTEKAITRKAASASGDVRRTTWHGALADAMRTGVGAFDAHGLQESE